MVKFENMGETVYSKLQAKFGEPLSPENYLAALQRENNSLVTQANQTLVALLNLQLIN